MKLVLNIKDEKNIILQLKNDRRVFNELHLTLSQNLDTLLIRAIDKILSRNKIDGLSLKTLEIQGKLRPQAVSGMIIRTVKTGLEV